MKLRTSFIITLSFVVLFAFVPQKDKKTIIFFGDSLTAGMGLSKEQAFPFLVQELLTKKGNNVEVINAGLSGETTAGGFSRVDWILRKPIDIFVLELGANDALRGLPLDQTKQNLQGIIDKVKAKYPNATIIVAGMQAPPNLGTQYINTFKEIFPSIAHENNLVLIPFILENVAGHTELNLPDGIHPNVDGHKIVANNIVKYFENLL
ncbi:MAG: arylesterase [Cyclobacteriaceae bacterium]|nr:arylesterase [Cyclobacteriaceae bacterium]